MGTDIHLHLEYHTTPPGKALREQAKLSHPLYARPVIANRYFVPRDYHLFAALADVCNTDRKPVRFAPRGLPEDVSREIFHQYFVEIFAEDVPLDWLQAGCKWCRPEDAKKAVERGQRIVPDGSRQFVPGEDYHHPSHLYLHEFQQALEFAGYAESQCSPELLLVIQAMKFIDSRYGDQCARIVFWFDS
jgi:hypothetical protein